MFQDVICSHSALMRQDGMRCRLTSTERHCCRAALAMPLPSRCLTSGQGKHIHIYWQSTLSILCSGRFASDAAGLQPHLALPTILIICKCNRHTQENQLVPLSNAATLIKGTVIAHVHSIPAWQSCHIMRIHRAPSAGHLSQSPLPCTDLNELQNAT